MATAGARREAARLAWAIVVLAIPLGSLAADSALHLWLDNGNMRVLGIGAFIATIISAMFHWHVMQNGAMLVGNDSGSFGEDIKQMPRLVASFVWKPVRLATSDSRLRGEELSAEALSDAAEMKSQPDLLPLIHFRQIPVIILPPPCFLAGMEDTWPRKNAGSKM